MAKLKAKIIESFKALFKYLVLYAITIYKEQITQPEKPIAPKENKPRFSKSGFDEIDQMIVSLCFVCHWSFSDACNFVSETPIRKVRAFMAELAYQKSVEDYRVASYSALIICTWANAQKKGNHYQIKDFIGQPPQRANTKSTLSKAIEKAGIKMPEG